MAAQTTYDQSATNARDVTAKVTNVSPKDSPIFSMLGSHKITARIVEQPVDSLTAASATNAMVEGAAFAAASLPARTMETNTTQIFQKNIEVTGTQEEVAKYGGVDSELAYQTTMKYTELATDVEKTIIIGTAVTPGDNNTARRLSGMIEKIVTNVINPLNNADSMIATTSDGYTAMGEVLNDLIQSGYTTGQNFDTIVCGGYFKRRISKLSTVVSGLHANVDAGDKTRVNSINTYDSDFGVVNIMLDRYVPGALSGGVVTTGAAILALKMDAWEIGYLRRFKAMPLAKVGDSDKVSIVGELTLTATTEKAGGKIVVVAA